MSSMMSSGAKADSPEAKKARTGDEIAGVVDGSDEFSFSTEPTLDQIRQLQSEFCKERNWGKYHTPRNLLLAMVGEVGEVAELFQWRGDVKDGLPDWTSEEKTQLGHELSDVLIYLVRLAEKCQIDLPTAAKAKIALNHQKYPADKVYGSSKKYTEYKQQQREDNP